MKIGLSRFLIGIHRQIRRCLQKVLSKVLWLPLTKKRLRGSVFDVGEFCRREEWIGGREV